MAYLALKVRALPTKIRKVLFLPLSSQKSLRETIKVHYQPPQLESVTPQPLDVS